MPEGVTVGDVIRVKSVVASTHNNSKQVLVPTDHSNILIISKMFKLY
jgi:tRNA(Arg) A34 adenosine deaminase TadA